MKSEYIVSKIEASEDEASPYVHVLFNNSDAKDRKQPQSPFNSASSFPSPEDLMKHLPKILGGMKGNFGIDLGDSPAFKLTLKEYNESGLKVGDRVTIEITKENDTGI